MSYIRIERVFENHRTNFYANFVFFRQVILCLIIAGCYKGNNVTKVHPLKSTSKETTKIICHEQIEDAQEKQEINSAIILHNCNSEVLGQQQKNAAIISHDYNSEVLEQQQSGAESTNQEPTENTSEHKEQDAAIILQKHARRMLEQKKIEKQKNAAIISHDCNSEVLEQQQSGAESTSQETAEDTLEHEEQDVESTRKKKEKIEAFIHALWSTIACQDPKHAEGDANSMTGSSENMPVKQQVLQTIKTFINRFSLCPSWSTQDSKHAENDAESVTGSSESMSEQQ